MDVMGITHMCFFLHFFVVISLARAFCTQPAPSVTLQPARLDLNQQTAQTMKRRFICLFGPHTYTFASPPPFPHQKLHK